MLGCFRMRRKDMILMDHKELVPDRPSVLTIELGRRSDRTIESDVYCEMRLVTKQEGDNLVTRYEGHGHTHLDPEHASKRIIKALEKRGFSNELVSGAIVAAVMGMADGNFSSSSRSSSPTPSE